MLSEQEQNISCCGTLYRNDAVRMLLGESWHPGGLGLTAQLARLAEISSSYMVLDLACGNGATSGFLEKEFGCAVVGLDVLRENVKEASYPTSGGHIGNDFLVGEAHCLPFAEGSFDLIVLECTLSSFQNKRFVLDEVHRISKPESRLAISDIHVNGEIAAELKQVPFQELCIAGALSLDEYCNLLEKAGFNIVARQNRREEAVEFIDLIRKKLFVAQLLVGVRKLALDLSTIEKASHLAALCKQSIEQAKLGYCVIVAEKRKI